MNSVLKLFGMLFLIAIIFLFFTFCFMTCWNNGLAVAINGINHIEFKTAAWVVTLLLCTNSIFWRYPQRSAS